LLSAPAARMSPEQVEMKYDDVTYLLIEIFQQANPLEPAPNPGKFVDFFRFQIDQVGSVLQFLGLGEESEQSDLGWVPNRQLMRIIAEQVANSSNKRDKSLVNKDDHDFVDSICQIAAGHIYAAELTEFCCNVLAIFGLVEKGNGEFKPTPRMKDLVLERLLERAVEVLEVEANEEEEEEED
jgi:hypothetical protein